MGCDGGTIPKRQEIVKNKQKDAVRDKNVDLSAKWQFCALSGLRLKRPIVACQLGRLYNKTAIIEYLLDYKTANKPTTFSPVVSHIKSLKHVRELTLTDRSSSNRNGSSSTSSDEHLRSQFVCPTTGLEMSGRYKFYFLFTCGCVISERALKQVPNDKKCILCSKPYDPELDLIVINGDEEEMKELGERLAERRSQRTQVDKQDSAKISFEYCRSSGSATKKIKTKP